jgi:L-ascorbate metabolism protein UlaG (beta-lactamase superfamily)
MDIRLDWLGCATFRLTLGTTVVFLDSYMERVPSAPPVGLLPADVERAGFILVGHAHFDHIAGAEVIAKRTGAKVVGSIESLRVMREQAVPEDQLLPAQGGERYRLAPDVTVRVLPSLHSCTWSTGSFSANEPITGHLGLCEDERMAVARERGLGASLARSGREPSQAAVEMREHVARSVGSSHTGGALAYLLEAPGLSIFWQDTSGCWTGVLRDVRPDVAILAAAGRGNVDGEPIQGSLAEFAALEAKLLAPKVIVLGHHDNWMPPLTGRGGTDTTPIRSALAEAAPSAELLEPGYLEGTRLQ